MHSVRRLRLIFAYRSYDDRYKPSMLAHVKKGEKEGEEEKEKKRKRKEGRRGEEEEDREGVYVFIA